MVRALLLAGLLLAGCGPSERPPPPYFVIPPLPAASPASATAPAEHGGLPGPVIRPSPEVQRFLPGPSPDELGRGPPPVPEPGRSAGPYYTPQATSPITGFGPGGFAPLPGAPPNPPYPARGLMPGP